ncbi:ribosome small subunit-dependent GTPase A [Bacillus horti]|uniref:Small ribosomal subunit biogenesis GTPase RsgA n=1 Tax=Caldalkalibacillus horti TaxID=77523 RepID=A0ABT9VXK8_9BACI|nr:ribosome small subunit-dependent GTPase A [Bacillus horti]MDQ0165704.1 ribosome biogenesis GTPase [Bacillus horti]
MPEGQIVKALSGFYYVAEKTTGTVWQCRARGVFKKKKITPLVGDHVSFEGSVEEEGTVTEIHERKNELIRPPIANVDQALLVFSVDEPEFSPILLDKFLVHIEKANITPVICLTKLDLSVTPLTEYPEIEVYQKLGYPFYMTSSVSKHGVEEIEDFLANKITVFAGQSGVGKSTLLNAINPELDIETAEISTRLGRGRHTTRHVELIKLPKGGLVADTPGFSQLDFIDIAPEELGSLFIEFNELSPSCKFRECLHKNEPKCGVKDAVEQGEIAEHRYKHYLQFLETIEQEKQKRGY